MFASAVPGVDLTPRLYPGYRIRSAVIVRILRKPLALTGILARLPARRGGAVALMLGIARVGRESLTAVLAEFPFSSSHVVSAPTS